MDVITLLMQQHRKVEELFLQAGAYTYDVHKQLKENLTLHAELEETHFYPAVEKKKVLKDLVSHSEEEHAEVKELLAELEKSEDKAGVLETLKARVNHHVREEERMLFPAVRREFTEEELNEIGMKMLEDM